MIIYLKDLWKSISLLIFLMVFKKHIHGILAFILVSVVLSSYISYIFRYRILYVSANRKGIRDFGEFKRMDKVENYLYSFFEAIIVTALILFPLFINQSTVSFILFSLGAAYLIFSHIKKNVAEKYFYLGDN